MADYQHQKKNDDLASEVLEHLKNPPVDVINPKGSGGGTKKYIIVTAVLTIVIFAAGFAVWKFLIHEDQVDPVASEDRSVSEITEESANELSQQYVSDRMMIDVKHPSNWKATEENNKIEIFSPETEVLDAEGNKLPAVFKVFIKLGAERSDSEYLGRGFAVKKSEPISYEDPALNQRKDSLVTGFGLDSSDHFAYFVVQGNFNLKKNESLGGEFAGKADEILVSGGFYSEESEDRTKLVAMSPDSYSSNELYKTAIEIIKTLRLR